MKVEGLDPVLLFQVHFRNSRIKDIKGMTCGVYFVPQKGFAIDGFISDGSSRSVARHITKTIPMYKRVTVTSHEVYMPQELTEELIIDKIQTWMNKDVIGLRASVSEAKRKR